MPLYLPEKYEAGTLPTPSIVGLREGVKFILETGLENIEKYLEELTNYTLLGLKDIRGIEYVTGNCGVISFTAKDKSPSEISAYLAEHDICTRNGFHCAPFIHKRLGTKNGTVRVSLSCFNKYSDINSFLYRLNKIC